MSVSPKRTRCAAPIFCDRLEERLEENNADTKGLIPIVVGSILKEDSSRCIGVAYKASADDNGLMLEFCPFCGASISVVPSEGER